MRTEDALISIAYTLYQWRDGETVEDILDAVSDAAKLLDDVDADMFDRAWAEINRRERLKLNRQLTKGEDE